ncbi:MAG TPA: helix-turn-helix domain-containing protein [Alphaproteobacteria bacterium]|nr:helix-turn-helix domain-containing protein [Alphaproteobacteria bacterium]
MPLKKDQGQSARLIETLKSLFRSHGLRQADIAVALKLSRTTLKRRLSGQGLTIDALEALCGLVDVSLAELVELAAVGQDKRLRRLSLEQENALHEDVRLGFIFTRLREGWSATEIQRECRIGEAPLVGYLVRLEKLGLIDLLPGNRVRLHTVRDIDWRKHGPMWHSVDRYLADIFSMMDSDDAELDRRIAVVKLTPASVSQLDDMFRHLQMEVRRLANKDRSAEPDDKSWYAVLMGARPFEMDLDSDADIPWWRKGNRPAPRKSGPQNGPPRGHDMAHRDLS